MATFKDLAIAFVIAYTTSVSSNATIAEDSLAPAAKVPGIQIITAGEQAIMFDPKTEKTWILKSSDSQWAWLPIQRLDSREEAESWCRESGFHDIDRRQAQKTRIRQATLEKVIESSEPNLPVEGMLVAIARERAALRRLLAEFGSQHPEVLKSRERLRELLEVHELGVQIEPALSDTESEAGDAGEEKEKAETPEEELPALPPTSPPKKQPTPQPQPKRQPQPKTEKTEKAQNAEKAEPKAKSKEG